MVNYQWRIFWAELNPSVGSEQAGTRPVLVVSSEEVNQALPIVTILSITSFKIGRNIYPVEVLLKSDDSGLNKDSIVMAHQIRAISKDRLKKQCGMIESEEIREDIKKIMRVYLEID